MSESDPLLQPFQLKHLKLKNRIMSTSHACGLEEEGFPKERYQLYHEEKARGGLALTMFGGSSNVAPDSPNIFRQLNVGTNAVIPYLQQFSKRIHAHGTALMCQITHLGRRGDPYADNWLPTIAPSVVRETLHRSIPKEMDEHDIERVVKSYGEAARRCKEGGLDGLETLAGGHLIGQFLSPRTNKRTDRFGGSLRNRCRFAMMVHEEIRRQVGDEFIVGLRYVVDEASTDGLTFKDCVEAAKLLAASETLDFFNAIYGPMDTEFSLATYNMPGMGTPLAPWVDRVGEFKEAVDLPVFHAARIADVASARYAIRNGLVDMVAMTRAHIADPHIVRKLMSGNEARIRPCVGATHCQSQYRPSCLHNAASGRETTLPHVLRRSLNSPRKVVVIGAGPAGLEAARVAAERGHQVTLLEAQSELGGQVRLAARASWRKDIVGLVNWREEELLRLHVDVRTNVFADEGDVVQENPDVVIVATGGMPDIGWLDGGEYCTDLWDALTDNVELRDNIIIYDGTGRHSALQLVDMASAPNRQVSFFSIDSQIGQELTYAERVMWKHHIAERDVQLQFERELRKVKYAGSRLMATFRSPWSGTDEDILTDQVIVEHGTVPVDQLYQDLRRLSSNDGVTDIGALIGGAAQPADANGNGGFQLYRIGDAIASRNIHTAILDALRLCSTL